jgi:hypothetical protein
VHLLGVHKKVITAEICAQLCIEVESCASFTYQSSIGKCRLFAAAGLTSIRPSVGHDFYFESSRCLAGAPDGATAALLLPSTTFSCVLYDAASTTVGVEALVTFGLTLFDLDATGLTSPKHRLQACISGCQSSDGGFLACFDAKCKIERLNAPDCIDVGADGVGCEYNNELADITDGSVDFDRIVCPPLKLCA